MKQGKADAKGRTGSRLSKAHARFLKAPSGEGQGWSWLTLELLQSRAWRAMSKPARDVMDRIICEHIQHAGLENGRLIVTFSDFLKYGVRRASISRALIELQALRLLRVTRSKRSDGLNDPNKYRLEFYGWYDPESGEGDFPTNGWKVYDTQVGEPGYLSPKQAVKIALDEIESKKPKKSDDTSPSDIEAEDPDSNVVVLKAGNQT